MGQGAFQFVICTISQHRFAVDVTGVREAVDGYELTRIPRSPAHLLGVCNLRGEVIPVADISVLLDLDPVKGGTLLICDVESGRTSWSVGLACDEIHDVVPVSEAHVEDGAGYFDTRLIGRVFRHEDEFIPVILPELLENARLPEVGV